MDRIDFPVAGRARDYLDRAMKMIESRKATPILVGSSAMISQARAIVGANVETLVITDFDVDAVRARAKDEYPQTAVFLLLPENYLQFIYLNRGLRDLREKGFCCVFVTGRDYYVAGETIDTLGRMERAQMFRLAGHYVATQQFQFIAGGAVDYYEFGCFDGASMSLAFAAFGHLLPRMQFIGFDTFAGIARSGEGEYSFPDGDWAANLESFQFNMGALGIPSERLRVCPGEITVTLSNPHAVGSLGASKCGIAHIDCDVYEPAKAALNLLKERMPSGGLVLFDDWDTMDASDAVGERRAAAEFLAENPGFSLEPYQNYAWHSRSFIFKRA